MFFFLFIVFFSLKQECSSHFTLDKLILLFTLTSFPQITQEAILVFFLDAKKQEQVLEQVTVL